MCVHADRGINELWNCLPLISCEQRQAQNRTLRYKAVAMPNVLAQASRPVNRTKIVLRSVSCPDMLGVLLCLFYSSELSTGILGGGGGAQWGEGGVLSKHLESRPVAFSQHLQSCRASAGKRGGGREHPSPFSLRQFGNQFRCILGQQVEKVSTRFID